MTAAADFRHGGLCGRLVGAPQCRSRVIFCRVGPALVDVVSLWLSPRGKVLCSCRDHTQNVALASTTGRACNCWHAQAFEVGMRDLSSERFAIFDALQVKPGAEQHAFTFDLLGTRCAVAFDGKIFSPVVATERRFMRCIAFSCRSLERSCTHVRLTRALPVFASAGTSADCSGSFSDEDRAMSDGDETPQKKASTNYGRYGDATCDAADDFNAILEVHATRTKRNLLPCLEEQKMAERWMRTADLLAMSGRIRVGGSRSSAAATESPLTPSALDTLHRCGLVFSPSQALCEKKCYECGCEREADTIIKRTPALVFTHHPTAPPLQVRMVHHHIDHLFLISLLPGGQIEFRQVLLEHILTPTVSASFLFILFYISVLAG